jgi:hypothetical protein
MPPQLRLGRSGLATQTLSTHQYIACSPLTRNLGASWHSRPPLDKDNFNTHGPASENGSSTLCDGLPFTVTSNQKNFLLGIGKRGNRVYVTDRGRSLEIGRAQPDLGRVESNY